MTRTRPVLVIDDDPDLCTLLRKTLEHERWEVVTAVDGMDAIRQYELNRPCMLIVDLMMPNLDGEEFLRVLGTPRPPVLLLTASERREEVADRFGIELHLAKPFELEEVRRIVRNNAGDHQRDE